MKIKTKIFCDFYKIKRVTLEKNTPYILLMISLLQQANKNNRWTGCFYTKLFLVLNNDL
nr:hypothetical protein B11C_10005 [Bartonella sp. 1-1C]